MPITMKCVCGKLLKAPDSLIGKKAKCPVCGRVIKVPDTQPASDGEAELPSVTTPNKQDNGESEHAKELIDDLSKDDIWPHEKDQIVDLLTQLGEPAVEPLIASLNHESPEVRFLSAKVLGNIGDRRAVEPLSRVLQAKEYDVVKFAAEALGKIGDPRAIEPLRNALKNRPYSIIGVIANALQKFKWQPTEPADYVYYLAAKKEWDAVEFKEAGLEPLMTALRNGIFDAAEAVAKIGKPAVPLLIEALEDKSPRTRELAAVALGKIGDTAALEPLTKRIQDDAPEVCGEAGIAIRKIKGQEPGKKRPWFAVLNTALTRNGYVLCYFDEAKAKTGFQTVCDFASEAKTSKKDKYSYSIILTHAKAFYPYILAVLTDAPESSRGYSGEVIDSLILGRERFSYEEWERMYPEKLNKFLSDQVLEIVDYQEF